MYLRKMKDAVELNCTVERKRKIIEIYALKICKLWDYYGEIIKEVSELHDSKVLSDNEYYKSIMRVAEETRKMLSVLFIEQYYNTGDESLFDRSLLMDEDVMLLQVSQINMNELNISEDSDRKMGGSVVIYYQGMFINVEDVSKSVFTEQYSEILLRDEKVVAKINKKLSRARTILNVDEVTLGKKYYDGLCMRSHYR